MPAESDGRFGPRTLGGLQLATPGCAVHTDPDKQRDPDGYGLGGILVAVEDTATEDLETGEITARRAFKVWDLQRRRWQHIPEDLCGPESVEGFDSGRVTFATYQMASEYVKRRGKTGRKLLVGDDLDLLHGAWTLARALMGDRP